MLGLGQRAAKRAGALLLTLAAAIATDNAGAQPPGALAELAIHHVQISVADADALAAWYVDTLGFRMTKRVESNGFKVVWIDIPNFRLGLAQVEGSTRPASASLIPPADVGSQGYRQIHFSVPDVDAAYAALSSRGVAFALAPRSYDQTRIRLATFADPEGNVISLYQDLDPANALMPSHSR